MKSMIRLVAVLVVGNVAAVGWSDTFSDYEDQTEGFKGQTFALHGVTYRDVNNVSGFYPDGIPFGPNDNGNDVIVERAVPFYVDFPSYGSPVNALTFGSAFIPGDNLSIGALASVWMDLPEVSSAATLDIGFYENGPWGGIEWRLEALRNGAIVGTDSIVISDLGGRDNPTVDVMSVGGMEFDQLHLYGWLNNDYTVPRGIIDDLRTTAVPEPTALAVWGVLAMIAGARRPGSR